MLHSSSTQLLINAGDWQFFVYFYCGTKNDCCFQFINHNTQESAVHSNMFVGHYTWITIMFACYCAKISCNTVNSVFRQPKRYFMHVFSLFCLDTTVILKLKWYSVLRIARPYHATGLCAIICLWFPVDFHSNMLFPTCSATLYTPEVWRNF